MDVLSNLIDWPLPVGGVEEKLKPMPFGVSEKVVDDVELAGVLLLLDAPPDMCSLTLLTKSGVFMERPDEEMSSGVGRFLPE